MSRIEFTSWLLCLAALAPARAASLLEQRIEELRRTSHAIEGGLVGIEVVQLGTGKLLYAINEDRLFTPASNTKLFTSALALTRLGRDYRMTTRVTAATAPDTLGRIHGNLSIVGGGDPSMSFIAVPYARDSKPADPLAGVEALADQLVARGIRTIDGDIVGDDTAYPADFFPPGWGIDDPLWDYGAPVSALCLGDNSIRMDLLPGAAEGSPVSVEFTPRIEYYLVSNRLRTVTGGPSRVELRRQGRQLDISGTVSRDAGTVTNWLAVDDPALYMAAALYDVLTRRGISIHGQPVALHRYADRPAPTLPVVVLAERQSPPLIDLLRVTDKVSQNLWAEIMLREVSRAMGGGGSRGRGLKEMAAFLTEIGLSEHDYVFEDGSGLSRVTLVKPDAVVRLLRFMRKSGVSDAWTALMPVGGDDGTLEKRFHKDPAARNIHAKTGSLSHVNALSGYADSATYGEVAFSILVNHTDAPSSEVRAFIDKIGMILLE